MKTRASWPMKDLEVRAILAGNKTQTRRVVKPQPAEGVVYGPDCGGVLKVPRYSGMHLVSCPYGQPGDRLYIRETWANCYEDNTLVYRADLRRGGDADAFERNRLEGATGYRWKPSVLMPSWASRAMLEITGIRVERLQDISDEDAKAEGVDPWNDLRSVTVWEKVYGYREAFRQRWEQMHGPDSWARNDYVWVYEHKLT